MHEKVQSLIVVHASGVEGWVEDAELVLRFKKSLTDYHDDMNSEHHLEWLTEQLLPRQYRQTFGDHT